jgi:hypothetical protein
MFGFGTACLEVGRTGVIASRVGLLACRPVRFQSCPWLSRLRPYGALAEFHGLALVTRVIGSEALPWALLREARYTAKWHAQPEQPQCNARGARLIVRSFFQPAVHQLDAGSEE